MNQRLLLLALAATVLLLCGAVVALLVRGGPAPPETAVASIGNGEPAPQAEVSSRGIGGVVSETRAPEAKQRTIAEQPTSQAEIPLPPQVDIESLRRQHLQLVRDQQQSLQSQAASLNDDVGDPPQFAAHLGRLAKSFPKSVSAPAFRQVSVEAPQWKAVLDWSRLFKELDLDALKTLSPGKAKQLVNEGDRLRTSADVKEYSELYEHAREHILRVASRVDFAGVRIDKSLDRFLNEALMGQLIMVEDSDQRQFYVLSKRAIGPRVGAEVPFKYVVDHSLKVKGGSITFGKGRLVEPAPHCELARNIRTQLRSDDLLTAGWDRVFCDMLEMILRCEDASPLPKLEIYGKTLEIACLGSAAMNQAFDPHRRDLKNAAFIDRTAKWFDPNDLAGQTAGDQASQVLEQLAPIAAIRKNIFQSGGPLDDANVAPVDWIAMLRKSDDGQWEAAGIDRSPDDGPLYVVARNRDLAARLFKVGSLVDGREQWDADADNLLLEGRPLFFHPTVRNVAN